MLLGILGSFIYGIFLGGISIFAGSLLLSLLVAVIINPIITGKYDKDTWYNNKIAEQIRKRDPGFSTEAIATVLNSRMQVLHFAMQTAETKVFVKFDTKELLAQYENIIYLNMERYRLKKAGRMNVFNTLMLTCFYKVINIMAKRLNK